MEILCYYVQSSASSHYRVEHHVCLKDKKQGKQDHSLPMKQLLQLNIQGDLLKKRSREANSNFSRGGGVPKCPDRRGRMALQGLQSQSDLGSSEEVIV